MDTARFYKAKSKFYRMNAVRKKYILDLIPGNVSTVLDIGCGSGELASVLKNRGINVIGIDISEEALSEAKEFLLESFCFNLEAEKWPEELIVQKFDLIIASEVIEHLFDPGSFLRKIKKLLFSNGKIIITTPNFLFWKNRLKMFLGKFGYEKEGLLDFGHIRFFTRQTLKDMVEKEGFKIEKEKNFYPNLYFRHMNWLGDILPGLFAYQLIVLLSRK